MPKLKSSEFRKLSDKELQNKLTELKIELAHLDTSRSRGTLKKASGKIRFIKRSIARIFTIINENKKGKKIVDQGSSSKSPSKSSSTSSSKSSKSSSIKTPIAP